MTSWKIPFGLAMVLLGAVLVIPVSRASGFGPMGFVISLFFAAVVAVGLGLILSLAKATRPVGLGLLIAGLAVPAGFALTVLSQSGTREPQFLWPTDRRVKVVHYADAEPIAGVTDRNVTARLTVGPSGSVEWVAVTAGPGALRASAEKALKAFRFAPVVIGRQPVRFATEVTLRVPNVGGPGDDEPSRSAEQVKACSRALTTMNGSPASIQTCRDAVIAADEAKDAVARLQARRLLGDVYGFGSRWMDAIAAYRSALDVAPPADDFFKGEMLTKVARAQMKLGDTAAADRSAAAAVAALRTSMAQHPEQKEEHVAALRDTLLFHASTKAMGADYPARDAIRRQEDELKP